MLVVGLPCTPAVPGVPRSYAAPKVQQVRPEHSGWMGGTKRVLSTTRRIQASEDWAQVTYRKASKIYLQLLFCTRQYQLKQTYMLSFHTCCRYSKH